MDSLRTTNDSAVSCLQQDKAMLAKAYLTNAMDQIRSSLQGSASLEMKDLEGKAEVSAANNQMNSPSSQTTGTINFRSIPLNFVDEPFIDQEHEAFHLFARPFVFDIAPQPFEFRRTTQETPSILPSQRAQLSAALLFNLGLVNHLQYLKQGNSERNRDFALQSYESSVFILLKMAQLRSEDSAMAILLAVCSNIMALYYELGDLESLVSWKKQLAVALQSYQPKKANDYFLVAFFYHSLNLPEPTRARAA